MTLLTQQTDYVASQNSFLCHNCYSWLNRGKCPPMNVRNGMEIDDIPDELQLSELEAQLVSKNILFFKLFKLPKSRWSAVTDKIINVPINDGDILKTLRNPWILISTDLVEIRIHA